MDLNRDKFDLLRVVLPYVPLVYKEEASDARVIAYENHAWVCYDVERAVRRDVCRARSFDQIAEKCILQCFSGDKEKALRVYKEACEKLKSAAC